MAMMTAFAMATSLTDGLVGYWPFDGDAKDYSGNGNHGTTHGVTLTADRNGNSGCAYHFGRGKYISVPSVGQLNEITDFSVCAWVKANALDNYCIPVLCKGCHYRLEIADNGLDWCQMQNPGANSVFSVDCEIDGGSVFSSARISTGNWMHVAVSRNGRQINAYLNGNCIGSSSATSSARMNSGDIVIGMDPPGALEYLIGSMDELYLYNRALSSSEISALYNGGLKVCKVTFNSNGGIESMEELKTLSGKSLTLPANQFTRDGYIFLGWALSPDGEVDYRDGEEIDVDSDMTLYTVWGNPALTLTAESADWSSGSITLRCEDADTSGAAHTYSLEYLDENNAWDAVGGSGAANVAAAADGFAHLTDGNFCSRLDGIKTVSYRVKDENGRVSEPCVTRNRYGLSVGIGQYAGYDLGLDNNVGFAVDANLCRNLALSQGGFSRFGEFLDSNATTTPIRKEMATLAQLAKPGDTVMFFVSAHGGNGKIHLYGLSSYSTAQLQADVDAFNSGVAVIGIIMACHSGSLLQLGLWSGNAALISSCAAKQISILFGGGNVVPSPFGGILLQDGWEAGYADRSLFGTSWGGGNGDGVVTFDELARYAAEFSKGYSDMVASSSVQVTNRKLLEHTIAGRAGSGASFVRPLPPASCEATHGISDAEIQVTWAQVADPTIRRYWLFRKKPGDDKATCISRYAGNGSFSDARTIEKTTLPKTQGIPSSRIAPENFVEYQYYVCSVNPCGISDPSPVATGMSGTVNLQQWYSGLGYTTSAEIALARTSMASNKENTIEECYVTGISPTDETARFEARIEIGADGKPVVKWSPDLNEGGTKEVRVYRVMGAKELGAAAQWDDVTDIADTAAEGYRFFKVTVEMP